MIGVIANQRTENYPINKRTGLRCNLRAFALGHSVLGQGAGSNRHKKQELTIQTGLNRLKSN